MESGKYPENSLTHWFDHKISSSHWYSLVWPQKLVFSQLNHGCTTQEGLNIQIYKLKHTFIVAQEKMMHVSEEFLNTNRFDHKRLCSHNWTMVVPLNRVYQIVNIQIYIYQAILTPHCLNWQRSLYTWFFWKTSTKLWWGRNSLLWFHLSNIFLCKVTIVLT